MAEPMMKIQNDRVFFITSNQSKLEPNIQYLVKNKFAANLRCNLLKEVMHKRENFIIHVFSFEVIRNKLTENDIQNKAYKAKVTLKNKTDIFEGDIIFREKKQNLTNFIYDLEFKEYAGWFGTKIPPPSIKFSKAEQLKLYNEMFKKLGIKQNNPISNILITDSIYHINRKKFYFDFYLEILRACYSNIEVKMLLMMFNLQNVILTEKMDKKDYITILNLI